METLRNILSWAGLISSMLLNLTGLCLVLWFAWKVFGPERK